jgi:hypothetical protein
VVFDRERERQDDAVYAEHKRAVAAGEKRVLRRTSAGELHNYPGDEISFTPGRGHAQVSTWWGMGILAAFAVLLAVFSVAIFLSPTATGEGPFWGALFLTALSAAIGWYSLTLARDEYRATRRRKLRGSPKPGTSGRVDINLLELEHQPKEKGR